MILRTVARGSFAADGIEQRFFEDSQVADVVDRHQVLGRVVGLEVADTGVLGRFFKQGLVAVREGCAALGQGLAHAVDGVGGQHIVVVGQGQVVPGSELGGLVCVGGDALILNFGVDDALVLRGAGLHGFGNVGVGVIAGIHQHQLPVRRSLGLHAVQKLLQKLRWCVVQRRQDADGGPGLSGRVGTLSV